MAPFLLGWTCPRKIDYEKSYEIINALAGRRMNSKFFILQSATPRVVFEFLVRSIAIACIYFPLIKRELPSPFANITFILTLTYICIIFLLKSLFRYIYVAICKINNSLAFSAQPTSAVRARAIQDTSILCEEKKTKINAVAPHLPPPRHASRAPRLWAQLLRMDIPVGS